MFELKSTLRAGLAGGLEGYFSVPVSYSHVEDVSSSRYVRDADSFSMADVRFGLQYQLFSESLEAPAVSLADIVLRLSVEELQSRKSEGFSMLDLKGAALRLGYMAEGVMLPREAVNVLPGPIIILLRRKDINHFAVLKGVSQGCAFLADPSRGHIRVPLHTLFDEWKGEAQQGYSFGARHGSESARYPAVMNLWEPSLLVNASAQKTSWVADPPPSRASALL